MKYYDDFTWPVRLNLLQCGLMTARKEVAKRLGNSFEAILFHSLIWHHDYPDFSVRIPYFLIRDEFNNEIF